MTDYGSNWNDDRKRVMEIVERTQSNTYGSAVINQFNLYLGTHLSPDGRVVAWYDSPDVIYGIIGKYDAAQWDKSQGAMGGELYTDGKIVTTYTSGQSYTVPNPAMQQSQIQTQTVSPLASPVAQIVTGETLKTSTLPGWAAPTAKSPQEAWSNLVQKTPFKSDVIKSTYNPLSGMMSQDIFSGGKISTSAYIFGWSPTQQGGGTATIIKPEYVKNEEKLSITTMFEPMKSDNKMMSSLMEVPKGFAYGFMTAPIGIVKLPFSIAETAAQTAFYGPGIIPAKISKGLGDIGTAFAQRPSFSLASVAGAVTFGWAVSEAKEMIAGPRKMEAAGGFKVEMIDEERGIGTGLIKDSSKQTGKVYFDVSTKQLGEKTVLAAEKGKIVISKPVGLLGKLKSRITGSPMTTETEIGIGEIEVIRDLPDEAFTIDRSILTKEGSAEIFKGTTVSEKIFESEAAASYKNLGLVSGNNLLSKLESGTLVIKPKGTNIFGTGGVFTIMKFDLPSVVKLTGKVGNVYQAATSTTSIYTPPLITLPQFSVMTPQKTSLFTLKKPPIMTLTKQKESVSLSIVPKTTKSYSISLPKPSQQALTITKPDIKLTSKSVSVGIGTFQPSREAVITATSTKAATATKEAFKTTAPAKTVTPNIPAFANMPHMAPVKTPPHIPMMFDMPSGRGGISRSRPMISGKQRVKYTPSVGGIMLGRSIRRAPTRPGTGLGIRPFVRGIKRKLRI